MMMNKQQTSYKGIWKYALLIPVITLLVGFHSILKAENQQEKQKMADREISVIASPVDQTDQTTTDNPIYNHVERMPAFPGGEQSLMRWLAENIKYPVEAQEQGIQGRVIVRFVIMPDGSVQNVVVVRSVDPSLDAEAIRVTESMPNWTPGKQNGVAVAVYYTLPIVFKLTDEKPKKNNNEQTINENDLIVIGYGVKEEKQLNTVMPKDILILLDGKEISHEEMRQLKPENMESIDVLKEVSATELYGERGKNGVVLISSKKLNIH